jgi:hypothetical protein
MTIADALTIAFHFTGQSVPDIVIAEMARDLSVYDEKDVFVALKKCRDKGRFIKFSDILDQLPNGHPGPEEAWAIVAPLLTDESRSAVWSDEMRTAYGAALDVADDKVQARMVFKEIYEKAVSDARAQKLKPTWALSKGTNKPELERVIVEGIKANRLTVAYAKIHLPYPDDPAVAKLMVEQLAPKLLR